MASRRVTPVVAIKRCDPICAAAGECCFERAYQIGRLDERNRRAFHPPTDVPALYDVARDVMHSFGFPWTDPRTGKTYLPPRLAKRRRGKR